MKQDLKKQDHYRAQHGEYDILSVPAMSFLMIDGEGDPNTSTDYADALAALYPFAYTIKFLSKNEIGVDYVVMPLEGLWWSDDLSTFTSREKDRWKWTMMIMTPDWISSDIVTQAREKVSAKKDAPHSLHRVRFETFNEGLSIQTLHVGPYDDEGPTVEAMHDQAESNGYQLRGHHHEIYLSDPRRADPAKLRTILRQPLAGPTTRS